MKLAYADPPYLGCCKLYDHYHGDDGKCWDDVRTHIDLLTRLDDEYDGWAYSLTSTSLETILHATREHGVGPFRVMAWVKPFAAFKRNVSVAYAWEPLLIKEARKPVVSGRIVMRDWISESITMKKGLTGAKPPSVCRWMFEMLGADPDDQFDDIFPGTGIVSETWAAWSDEVATEVSA